MNTNQYQVCGIQNRIRLLDDENLACLLRLTCEKYVILKINLTTYLVINFFVYGFVELII